MLMVPIPKHFTGVDRKVFEVKGRRSKEPKPRKIPKEIASAIRRLFEKKLGIMLEKDRAQPHFTHLSKSLKVMSKPIDGNAVRPHIGKELDFVSYDPTEGDIAEILPLLEDGPKTRHWMPNPTGIGLSKTLASVGGNNTLDKKERRNCHRTPQRYMIILSGRRKIKPSYFSIWLGRRHHSFVPG